MALESMDIRLEAELMYSDDERAARSSSTELAL
jgi:hypothetical protein